MRKYLVPAVWAALYLCAIWFADPFIFGVLGLAALFWLAAPILIVAVLLLLLAIGTGRARRPPVILISVVLGFALLTGVSIPLNELVQERAVDAAKAYPGRIAPLLEDYRRTHGSYPASLDRLPSAPSLPRLLQRYGYRSDGKTYWFTFPQPGGLIDSWDYDSQTGTWQFSS